MNQNENNNLSSRGPRLGPQLFIPVVLTIVAFVVSAYFIFIPTLERNLIAEKKEMIKELTQTAVSILDEYHKESTLGFISTDSAKNQAFKIISTLRYGDENKDYFWVTDMEPRMIVHPFRADLLGYKLDDYADPQGNKLFVESVLIVKNSGEGFLDYFWQSKDDSTRIVPKLSYVEGFEEWKLIVGTGIYLEDVQQEISKLKTRLFWVFAIIILAVALVLYYFLRTGLLIEKKRREAESELHDSKEKYQSLVEASREGTVMSLEGKISYVNPTFLKRFGYQNDDIVELSPDEFIRNFTKSDSDLLLNFNLFAEGAEAVITFEISLLDKDKKAIPVILTVSKITLGDRNGCIFVVKELSAQEKLTSQLSELSDELQTSLLFMNQPVNLMSRKPISCAMDVSIKKCAEIMMRSEQDAILITGPNEEFLGIVTDHDLRNRVIAKNFDLSQAVYGIMTSPLVTIPTNALMFEAMIALEENQLTHLGITDHSGVINGLISHHELLHVQQNTTSFLMQMIKQATHPDDLIKYSQKTIPMVLALEQSGAKTRNITRIITAVTDALTEGFIEMGIEALGEPPVNFAFISMGSEGRGEQTLATDQDNGIIFEDVNPDQESAVREYFMKLGKLVNDWLHQSGYQLCDGNVMAQNKKWNQPLSKWKILISSWVKEPSPQSVMDASIFFDFRYVSGDEGLVDELQNFSKAKFKNETALFYHLAQEALKFKPASASSGKIDLKKVIFPLTNFARIYSLSNGIVARNTFTRLNQISSLAITNPEIREQIINAYDFLMMLRFKAQLSSIEQNQEPTNMVDISKLGELEQNRLKKVLSVVSDTQAKLKLDFHH